MYKNACSNLHVRISCYFAMLWPQGFGCILQERASLKFLHLVLPHVSIHIICHNTWRHSTWLYLLELLSLLRMEAGKAWEQGLAIQFNFCMKTNVREKEGCVWWWRILSPFFVMSCQTGAFVRQVNCPIYSRLKKLLRNFHGLNTNRWFPHRCSEGCQYVVVVRWLHGQLPLIFALFNYSLMPKINLS